METRVMSVLSETLKMFGDDLNFSTLTPAAILAAMATSLLCGVIVYLVYRFCYRELAFISLA